MLQVTRREVQMVYERKAAVIGVLCGAGLAYGIYLGSDDLKDFDSALIWYAIGSIVAAVAVGYRFAVWAQRPPSRRYFGRLLELLFRARWPIAPRVQSNDSRVSGQTPAQARLLAAGTLGGAMAADFAAQNFIRR